MTAFCCQSTPDPDPLPPTPEVNTNPNFPAIPCLPFRSINPSGGHKTLGQSLLNVFPPWLWSQRQNAASNFLVSSSYGKAFRVSARSSCPCALSRLGAILPSCTHGHLLGMQLGGQLPPSPQTPKLSESVKVVHSNPFMLKGMIPLSTPDFPASLQSISFSTLCAYWPDSTSSTPRERKWAALGTSCRLLWVHRPGRPVSNRTAGAQLHSPFASDIPPLPFQVLGSYQVAPSTVGSSLINRRTLTLGSDSCITIMQLSKSNTSFGHDLVIEEAVKCFA